MLKIDTLKNGTPRIRLYGITPPPRAIFHVIVSTNTVIAWENVIYSFRSSDLGIQLLNFLSCPSQFKVHSLRSGKVAATPILKSVPSQFSPFIL